jgi:hypothetical protein
VSEWDGFAADVKAFVGDLLDDGPSVTYVVNETGETFKALEKPLSADDMPDLFLEGEDNSTGELNPLRLSAIPGDLDLRTNWNVYRQLSGNPRADLYLVRTVDIVPLSDTVLHKRAIITRAPTIQ